MQDSINRNSSRLQFAMRLVDIMALDVSGELTGLTRFSTSLNETAPIHLILIYFCCGLAFLLFPRFDVYTSWRGRSMPKMLLRLAASWGLILFIGVIFSFLIHYAGSLSRLWVFFWFFSGLILLILSRVIVYSTLKYLREKGLNNKRVIIVGYGPIGREIHRRASQQNWFGYDVKAVLADVADECALKSPAITRIFDMADIPRFAEANGIHEIWITLPMSASAPLLELQYLLRNALVDIRWIPDTLSMQILSSRVADFLGFPMVELNCPDSNGLNGMAKDLFDKVFSLLALILLAPLFGVIAVGIKYSSPGTVFFKQPRLGLNGKKFNVYKFRSMKMHEEHGTLTQATWNDARITRIGHFIRRTSLDELPQFINVLIGDMSVVGPRPHALQHNEMYKDLLELYMLRHRVKPGITGWAQIHGYRGETDTLEKMAKRVQFDLHYIQNWSHWMDFKIIVWTAFKGWTGKNTY